MSVFVTPPASMHVSTAPQQSAAPQSGPATPPAPAHDAIARRAYEIYVQKGRQPGQCQQNWRQAEQDLHNQGHGSCSPHPCGCGQAPGSSAGSAPAVKTVAGAAPAILGERTSTCCGTTSGPNGGRDSGSR
jgi:hypothetical protein